VLKSKKNWSNDYMFHTTIVYKSATYFN